MHLNITLLLSVLCKYPDVLESELSIGNLIYGNVKLNDFIHVHSLDEPCVNGFTLFLKGTLLTDRTI